MIKSEKGFGLLQVIMVMGIIALMAFGVVQTTQLMTEKSIITKAQMGRDSVTNGILSMITEESLCNQLLNPTTFSISNLPCSGACIAGGNLSPAGTKYSDRQNLSFNLISPGSGPAQIGGQPYINSPAYYPQFNAYIGSVYFAGVTLPPYTEQASGTLHNASVYQGQLWINTGRPPDQGFSPNQTQSESLAMADRLITNNLYIWVQGGKVLGCGILKTPEQVCLDDLGGTAYNPNPTPPAPNCVNVQNPCTINGYYYLGPDPKNPSQPLCIQSAASCSSPGMTIVSNGSGGWTCQSMPQ